MPKLGVNRIVAEAMEAGNKVRKRFARNCTVQLKCREDEVEQWRAMARAEGLTTSEWIRRKCCQREADSAELAELIKLNYNFDRLASRIETMIAGWSV